MKTYTEKELRELDAFIAIRVFGWMRETRSMYAGELNVKGFGLNKHLHRGDKDRHFQLEHLFPHARYSTDPAAAMQVLETCYKDLSICSCKTPNGFKFWEPNGFDGAIEAPTLPLAIALFAKKLFANER